MPELRILRGFLTSHTCLRDDLKKVHKLDDSTRRKALVRLSFHHLRKATLTPEKVIAPKAMLRFAGILD